MGMIHVIRNLVPHIDYKEVALFYKGTRLIPVCLSNELGCETPDAYAVFRIITWLDRTISYVMVSSPYNYQTGEYHGKETKE